MRFEEQILEIESDAAGNSTIANARWADPDYIVDRYPFEPGKIWVGRNPHCFEDAIGYSDSRHVLVCAGSGSGKGRSFIVNNLAVWPGSTVTYDPKGDLPRILAARRGNGDQFCEGMEQDVYVLDPLGKSGLGEEFLAYYDPLSSLDPNDGELPTWARRIAASLVQKSEGTEAAEWTKRAERFISLVIMHVVTAPLYEGQRTLITVLSLIMEGEQTLFDHIAKKNPEAAQKMGDAYALLLEEMTINEGARGWIAKEARGLQRQFAKTPKFFESVRGEASDQLDWLKSEGIEISLTGQSGNAKRLNTDRAFDPSVLKDNPNGASVFIVMPQDDLKTYAPWVQCMMLGIFAAMRANPKPPASGHQTLMVIDEFLSLGYQDYIADAMDNIRGAGTKLVIVVQNFGKLKKLYGDEIDSFYSNSGLELYFGKIGEVAGDHLLKALGETEVVKTAKSTSTSRSKQVSTSTAEARGTTKSQGGSESESQSINIGTTESSSTTQGWQTNYSSGSSSSSSFNWNDGVNWSDSRNWGKSSGRTMGTNYSPHIFFQGLTRSNNYGTSLNRNRGGGKTRGGSSTKGGSNTQGTSHSEGGGQSASQSHSSGRSETRGESKQVGKSWQTGESFTSTETAGQSEGYQIGNGTAETFHKKPLLELHEMNSYFRDFSWEDRDHPAYPGLALVRINGEPPFFVRRSNYDQDSYFERCFSPEQVHGYLPLNEMPLLGYQYTPDHILEFSIPEKLRELGYAGRAQQKRFVWVEEGAPLMSASAEGEKTITAPSPIGGRIMTAIEGQSDEAGFVIALRGDRLLSEREKLDYSNNVYGPRLEQLRRVEEALLMAEQERERLRREEQERRKKQAEEDRLRAEREAAEQAKERAKSEGLERKEKAASERRAKEAQLEWNNYANERRALNAKIDAANAENNKFKMASWMVYPLLFIGGGGAFFMLAVGELMVAAPLGLVTALFLIFGEFSDPATKLATGGMSVPIFSHKAKEHELRKRYGEPPSANFVLPTLKDYRE